MTTLAAELLEAAGTAPLFPPQNASACPGGAVALTYASHPGRDDRFCRALESAVRTGVPLRVLGWGVPWEGLSQKLQGALDAVAVLPPACGVLFTDAFDVLFASPLAALFRDFSALKGAPPLVFAGECGCWPQVTKDAALGLAKGTLCNTVYPPSPTPYRYLNSGLWMGTAGAAAALLELVVRAANGQFGMATNDQEVVSDLYIEQGKANGTAPPGAPPIALDHAAALFQCMHSTDTAPLPTCTPHKDIVPAGGAWKNARTGSRPAVFHFNGGGKAHHLPTEAQSWWFRDSEAERRALAGPGVWSDDAVRATRLAFRGGEKELAFGDVCPGHIEARRRPKHKPKHK